jgi:hypothetical protein
MMIFILYLQNGIFQRRKCVEYFLFSLEMPVMHVYCRYCLNKWCVQYVQNYDRFCVYDATEEDSVLCQDCSNDSLGGGDICEVVVIFAFHQ